MVELLRRYFFTFQEISLPGIGMIQAKSISAVLDFPERKLFPPTYEAVLVAPDAAKEHVQVEWLAQKLRVTLAEAHESLHAFAADIQKALSEQSHFSFEDICILQQSTSGTIDCKKLLDITSGFKPQHAEKVIREQETHMVRVGEEERSSSEMEAILSEAAPSKKDYWWVAAILLLIVAVAGWYYFKTAHPFQSQHHSFFHPIHPKEAPATYRILP